MQILILLYLIKFWHEFGGRASATGSALNPCSGSSLPGSSPAAAYGLSRNILEQDIHINLLRSTAAFHPSGARLGYGGDVSSVVW